MEVIMTIKELINKTIEDCNDSLQKLYVSSNSFVQFHDNFVFDNFRDGKILKKKIEEKIIGVVDDEK
jgi:hypothetical protein